MKKKLLSIFLSMVMALTLVTPLTAMADETPDVSIGTAAELLAFATASQTASYEGQLVVLTDDIDMAGVSGFVGIGANKAGCVFSGTFDGQGHKISNLSWSVTGKPNGFFNIAGYGAEIRNLTLENYSLTGSQSGVDERHGLLVGTHYTGGTLAISNVHIVNGSYTNKSANGASTIGGILGVSLNGGLTIENCSVDADITIQNASATNAIGTSITATAALGVGGIVGRTDGNSARTISGCSFTGTISAGRCVGGIFGKNGGGATGMQVTNCTVNATINGTQEAVGGIGGLAIHNTTITGCAFNGTANCDSSSVGGILGYNMTNGTTTIESCSFSGAVQGTERVGGIVGNCARPVNITGPVSTGTVIGNGAGQYTRTGGVIGFVGAAATITDLTDSATVTAPNGGYDVGGVVGAQNQALTITDANVTAVVTVETGSNSTILGGMIGAIRGAYTGTVTNSRFGGTVTRTSNEGGTPLMGGIVGTIVNTTGTLAVSHVLMDGSVIATKNAYVGGIAGGTGQQGAVAISDTLITGTVTAPGGQAGAFLGLTDSGATAHLTGSITNSYALDTVCTDAKSVTTNGLLGKYPHEIELSGEVAALTAAQLTGANALLNASELDYDDYWAAIEDATPQLKSFKTGTDADTSNLLERTGATAPASIPSGKVFGGWYADAEFTTPVASDYTGLAFAKFVDENVLSVKSQKGLTKTDDGKTRLRIVTSVDSLDYQEVGFHITYNNASGVEKTVTASATTAYATLVGYTDPSTSVSYEPTVFSAESIRFIAFRLVASDDVVAQNPSGISVQPYWITADGVTVEGETFSSIRF